MLYVFSIEYGIISVYFVPVLCPNFPITYLCQVVKNDRGWIDEYKCLPFRGCTICVTGLDVGQRSEVEQLAKTYGGTYSGDLVMER